MTRVNQSIRPRCVEITGVNIHLIGRILIDKIELHATGEIEVFEGVDKINYYFWASTKDLSNLMSEIENSALKVETKVWDFVKSIGTEKWYLQKEDE